MRRLCLALLFLSLITSPAVARGVASPTQGVAGPQGSAGANGTNGKDGAPGAQGPQGPAGPKGDTGAQGAVGPAGPKASTFICNATINTGAILQVAVGVRTFSGIACAGVLTTDLLAVYPTTPGTFPAGWAVHHALPTAAGTISVVASVPVISVATTFTISVAVYAVNR